LISSNNPTGNVRRAGIRQENIVAGSGEHIALNVGQRKSRQPARGESAKDAELNSQRSDQAGTQVSITRASARLLTAEHGIEPIASESSRTFEQREESLMACCGGCRHGSRVGSADASFGQQQIAQDVASNATAFTAATRTLSNQATACIVELRSGELKGGVISRRLAIPAKEQSIWRERRRQRSGERS
jgi:hypothetical protein